MMALVLVLVPVLILVMVLTTGGRLITDNGQLTILYFVLCTFASALIRIPFLVTTCRSTCYPGRVHVSLHVLTYMQLLVISTCSYMY